MELGWFFPPKNRHIDREARGIVTFLPNALSPKGKPERERGATAICASCSFDVE